MYIYIYIYNYITNAPTCLLCFSDFDQNGNVSKNFIEHSQHKISQKSVRLESRYSMQMDVQTDGRTTNCLRSCCVKAPKRSHEGYDSSGQSGRNSDQVFHEDQFKEDYCLRGCDAV